MKTNQIMIRSDALDQRTRDGYFNASKLLNHWNDKCDKGEERNLDFYKRQKSVKEFIAYMQDVEKVKTPLQASKGRNSETWMHPMLFIDFAMYISLEFKAQVLKMVMDGLIKSREAAGDYFKEMSACILKTHVEINGVKPKPIIYIEEARLIKSIAGISQHRNSLTEDELNLITALQKVNTNLINKKVSKNTRIKQLKLTAESLKM